MLINWSCWSCFVKGTIHHKGHKLKQLRQNSLSRDYMREAIPNAKKVTSSAGVLFLSSFRFLYCQYSRLAMKQALPGLPTKRLRFPVLELADFSWSHPSVQWDWVPWLISPYSFSVEVSFLELSVSWNRNQGLLQKRKNKYSWHIGLSQLPIGTSLH